MNSLTVFSFESKEIRFVDGKPIANDVAEALGFKSPSDAIYRLVKDKNKGVCKIQTPGGAQQVAVLEEAGVYQLIFSSKLPNAEKFQDWVFEEVLPSIRKTGSYTQHQAITPPSQFDALEYAKNALAITGVEVAIVESWGLVTLATKIDPSNSDIYLSAQKLLASQIELPENLSTVTEVCELLEADGMTMTAKTLNKLLCKWGLQSLTRDSKNRIQYQLTDKSKGMGKIILNSAANGKSVPQLKWYATKLMEAIAIQADFKA